MNAFIKYISKKFVATSVFFVFLTIGFALYFLFTPTSISEDYALTIKPGETITKVAKKLHQAKVLSHPEWFVKTIVFLGYDKSIKAGYYKFKKGSSLYSIVKKILSGNISFHKVTIIEGLAFKDIKAQLDDLPHITQSSEEEFRQLNAGNLEGLLFPSTYFYKPSDQTIDIAKMAYRQMTEIVDELWDKRANIPVKTKYEALILASIIEKETSLDSEKPIIANVFYNRMNKGMRLQADPTVVYALGSRYKGRLSKKDLKIVSEYNTYRNNGLPPTPICSPGRASIQAALNPIKGEYYYFVANGLGRHLFGMTLQEHNKAVKYVKILTALRRNVITYIQSFLKMGLSTEILEEGKGAKK